MRLLLCFSLIFMQICLSTCNYVDIIDCPSLYKFDFSNLTDDQSVPPCFCDNATDDSVNLIQINCVFGSTLDDLEKTFSKVHEANKTVDRIIVEKMYVEPTGIPENFFQKNSVSPNTLIVRDCRAPNVFGDADNKLSGLQDGLKVLEISRCILSGIPEVLKSLKNLESLTLMEIGVEKIEKDNFSELKNLRSLDISDNGLTLVEQGAFENLHLLDRLFLGPGNSLKTAVLQEIKHLSFLNHLDLAGNQIDLIEDGIFSEMKNLTSLNLATNIIKKVGAKNFAGLDSLADLGLQENLINEIEPHSFADLKSLTSLSLRANFINKITSGMLKSKSMKWLSLMFNNLQELSNGTFEETPNLEVIDMNTNSQLEYLDPEAFRGLTDLLKLNLSYTNLTSLDSSTLKFVPNLMEFDLSNTDVYALDNSTFDPVKNLQVLRLADTRLVGLPEGIFKNNKQLDVLDLYGNNWVCDKRLKWLINFFKSKRDSLFTNGDPICQLPERLNNKSFFDVDI